MFIRVLQNDLNWHTMDCLPVPYAIDRKKPANIRAAIDLPTHRRHMAFSSDRCNLAKCLI
jgi:hypothetical protein